MKKNTTASSVAAALTSMMCVQGGASVAKQLFPVVGATGTTALRIGISAIFLNIINRPKISKFSKKEWLYCGLFGGSIALMNMIFYLAIQRIPLGLGVTIEFIGPLFLALFLSRKVLDIVWALFACAGILLIVPWQTNNVDIIGLGLAATAGVFWACYIVMGSKVSKEMNTNHAVSVGLVFATFIVVPVALFMGGLEKLTWGSLGLGVLVAILSSALPFSLDLVALKKLPAKTFSILTSLQPAFAAMSGLLFLKEHLTMTQWISIACVITASVGSTIFSTKKEA
ncbi:DMT family transporter [Myroides odoratimimus]|uniref:Inner membrane transporter RhtA n=1 Tax=Myroides profundi TaxID=480520 RepID=A0AAJ5BEC4_MYRPR|nr:MULTISPECIES: DMT family transporter [Myroides]AJA70636.1 putative permease, DMT superfamily [Myroides sp. A21]AJH15539.1 inner membrane transporter RhtA [Myroides profundi]MCA4806461.1 DMT family transporter [Myroides odoratimimus]MDM1066100.1 DMT family transporter [Myroides odoratimimus]MDM1085690.1 DMT family transporter [Myroides odoratimimus]